MSEIAFNLPTETGSTEMTRFNALRHGVLSRYTVAPWKDAEEYSAEDGRLVGNFGDSAAAEVPQRAECALRGRMARIGGDLAYAGTIFYCSQ
jgi:hypothetical protein